MSMTRVGDRVCMFQSDGHSHAGEVRFAAGGVGRNFADALGRLGIQPLFLTATGDGGAHAAHRRIDPAATVIRDSLAHLVRISLT